MTEISPTTTSTHFRVPVYSLENAPAVTVNTVDTSSESLPNEHVQVSVDRQSGYIIAEKTENNRTSTFEFDIVENAKSICGYRGGNPNKLPTPVIHALHEIGFSLNNYNPDNKWLHLWLEIRLIKGRIGHLGIGEVDALSQASRKAVEEELGFLDELFGTRFVTGNFEDHHELESNGKYGIVKQKLPDGTEQPAAFNPIPGLESYGDPRGTVVDDSAPHLLLEKPATEYDNHEYFGLVTSSDPFPPVGVRTHRSEETDQLYIDTITEYGVHRATFKITNSESCAYTGDLPVGCLSSYVLDAVNEAGFRVEDAVNIFANSSEHKQVAACDNKLRAIWRSVSQTKSGEPGSMMDRTLHALRTNLVTLFAALALYETMPGRYEKHVKTVSDRDTEDELVTKSAHYLMQIHAKSNPSDRKDLAAYFSELDYIREDIVGTRMESLTEVAVKIGIIWHAIEDEMHPPRR